MKKAWKLILGLIIILFIIQIMVFSPETLDIRETEDQSFNVFDKKSLDVRQKMEGIHFVEAEEDKKEWELWAERAISYFDDGEWELQAMKVLFFSEKGDIYTVHSESGKLTAKRNILLNGEVIISSTNGFEFKTTDVIYSADKKELIGKGKVLVTGPDSKGKPTITISGNGLSGDLSTSMITILGGVKAQKSFKNNRQIFIESERVQLSGESYQSKFINNVEIKSGELTMTASVAQIELSPKNHDVTSFKAEGDVKVSDHEKWTTSHQVEADIYRNKFVFKGSPRVVQGNDELVGDEIIFLDGGKKVKVIRAKLKYTDE